MSKVPILQSARAALEFRRLHWRRVTGVLTAVAVGGTLNAAGELSGNVGLRGIGEVIYLVATAMAYAALMRLAFADEHPDDPEFRPGPQGFQWGRPEWRLLGVALLVLFAYVIALLMVIFVAMLVLVVSGVSGAVKEGATPEALLAALGPGATTVLGLLMIAFMVGMIYAAVRISLAPAATVSRKRISVFETWRLTKGQAWPVLLATLLVSLPSIVTALVLAVVVRQTGHPTGPEGALQIAMPGALIVGLLPGLVVAYLQLPLGVGLVAYLFRGLRPPEEKA
ncbi:MAG TPA: hypothetical protein VL460_11965 [Caulobacteraceae bacterium]|jgi:hypothetical protein|nr:hypothetical protein [Caulobacteraceae bacterium]